MTTNVTLQPCDVWQHFLGIVSKWIYRHPFLHSLLVQHSPTGPRKLSDHLFCTENDNIGFRDCTWSQTFSRFTSKPVKWVWDSHCCYYVPTRPSWRQLNLWAMGFLVSPFSSAFVFGFLVARTTWRWAYGIGCLYSLLVVILIVFFGEET